MNLGPIASVRHSGMRGRPSFERFRRRPTGTLPDGRQKRIRNVAESGCSLRALRREILQSNGWSLRDLYRTLETPGANRLRDAHAALDSAVRAAYGMKEQEDPLAFLLRLNLELADKEAKGQLITPPGLPAVVPAAQEFVSQDCIQAQ